MLTLTKMYYPITATPFCHSDAYCEIVPCDALKPYIRCFWGSAHPLMKEQTETAPGLIIPDTCMDIIFDINYTKNSLSGGFCAMDEHSHLLGRCTASNELTATFAIRFYAWSAILFSEQDMRGSKNQSFVVEEFFKKLKCELEPLLFDVPTLQGKVKITEALLLKHLNINRAKDDFLNAVFFMLQNGGRAKISDVCNYSLLSERQLERTFQYHMGISPKTFSSLIRYQLLWQEMIFSPGFNMLDAVERHGYTDHSHLLHDFQKRHLLTPSEAVVLAKNSR